MTSQVPHQAGSQKQENNPYGFTTEAKPVPLISARKSYLGPVTQSRYRRTLKWYAALLIVGTMLSWWASPGVAAFGLGMTFPGAGFLLYAHGELPQILVHLGLFIGTVIAMLAAFFLWVATGNLLAPVSVWLGSALYAASMNHQHTGSIAPIAVPLTISISALYFYFRAQHKIETLQQERERINQYLTGRFTQVTPLNANTRLPDVPALPSSELPLLRFMLDRALQPVDEFNGFDKLDEFREAAKRYQLCNSSYALSLYQYAHAPAFRGYLSTAQQNLGYKMQDHRVWSYWRYENLWGNLKTNPDPVAFDNIMYYGWYGAMLGMYTSNEDDHQFSEPGSICLKHPGGECFNYSFKDFCQIIYNNFTQSDFCLFPCEPRWIYPMCNNFGAVSLILHDRLYRTDYWSKIKERYLTGLSDEFITLDGRILAIRDYRSGITVPGLTSSMADAAASYFMNPVAPELSRRSWEILRNDFIQVAAEGIHIKTNGWDNIDFGNYRPSKMTTYGLIGAAAREIGDAEIADLVCEKLDTTYHSQLSAGVRHYPGASVSAHAVLFCARNMRTNALHDLIQVGMPEPWKNGPLLDRATYPDVLVSRAVSDGQALELSLIPGGNAQRTTLGISQLTPNQHYQVKGSVNCRLQADHLGQAELVLDLPRQQPAALQLLIHPIT